MSALGCRAPTEPLWRGTERLGRSLGYGVHDPDPRTLAALTDDLVDTQSSHRAGSSPPADRR